MPEAPFPEIEHYPVLSMSMLYTFENFNSNLNHVRDSIIYQWRPVWNPNLSLGWISVTLIDPRSLLKQPSRKFLTVFSVSIRKATNIIRRQTIEAFAVPKNQMNRFIKFEKHDFLWRHTNCSLLTTYWKFQGLFGFFVVSCSFKVNPVEFKLAKKY